MTEVKINAAVLDSFRKYLQLAEKSRNTIDKYIRDVKAFGVFIRGEGISKELAIAFKEKLLADGYAVRSINSMIASLNSFFGFAGCEQCRIKNIKEQRQIFCPEEKELTKAEYSRLLSASERKGNKRLNLILQTICGTGIRVSELKFVTIEAVRRGEAVVFCKVKRRSVFIVKALQRKLLHYLTMFQTMSLHIAIMNVGSMKKVMLMLLSLLTKQFLQILLLIILQQVIYLKLELKIIVL